MNTKKVLQGMNTTPTKEGVYEVKSVHGDKVHARFSNWNGKYWGGVCHSAKEAGEKLNTDSKSNHMYNGWAVGWYLETETELQAEPKQTLTDKNIHIREFAIACINEGDYGSAIKALQIIHN